RVARPEIDQNSRKMPGVRTRGQRPVADDTARSRDHPPSGMQTCHPPEPYGIPTPRGAANSVDHERARDEEETRRQDAPEQRLANPILVGWSPRRILLATKV